MVVPLSSIPDVLSDGGSFEQNRLAVVQERLDNNKSRR